MRTIKFRGKSLSGEWLYGYLYKHGITPPSNFLCIGAAVLPWKDTVGVYVVDPETVGQFTGQHDKNGKEIYEGDIVRHDENSECFVVVYDAPEFCYKDNSFGFRYMVYTSELITVVGNIHDNPDLMEKGGEK